MEVFGFEHAKTQSEMRKANAGNFNVHVPRMYPPQHLIYIHSVSKKTFPMKHTYCKQPLKGCGPNERWVRCWTGTEPAQQVGPDEANGGNRIFDEPGDRGGWRVAIDILNPNNPTFDPYWSDSGAVGAFFGTSANSDLISQGLFPSLNEVPNEEELVKAEQIRDSRFRKLVDEAVRLEGFSQKELQTFIQDHPDVHPAMDALGLEAPWHKKHEIKQSCPNCGTQVKQGIAFHMYEGGLCVLDWKRAYEAGRVKKEDVPPAKRWQGFGKQEAA